MLHVAMDDNAFCSIEALSREISCHHAACDIRTWDFSTPLRCGRNDSEVEWQRCHFYIFSQPLFIEKGSPFVV